MSFSTWKSNFWDGEFSCVNSVMSVLKPDDFEGVRMKPIFFDFLSSLAAKQEH